MSNLSFKIIPALFVVIFNLSCKERVYNSAINTISDNNIVSKKGVKGSHLTTSSNIQKSIQGKVTRISDGDTFSLLFDNGFVVKVRLNGIDCPEKKQAFSKKAKTELSNLIFNKNVLVKYEKKDGYGRVLGDVFIDDLNINQEMVRTGLAWHYKKYSDDVILGQLEEEARNNRIGLWADPNPMPPWDYRKK